MASSTIRKAIGVVKDQTSISIAKVTGNVAPDLEVLIVKTTGHDNEPAEEKYIREILNLLSYSKSYINACVYSLSKRLSKTHDWIVALKALMLIHRLLVDGEPSFGQEIMCANRKGIRVLNMNDFHDEAHSNSWHYSGFVKSYAMFLDQKLELLAFEQKLSYGVDERSRSYGDLNDSVKKDSKMKIERVLERLNHLLRVLDRVLPCRPTGNARNSRMILVTLHFILKESFKIYIDIRESLDILLDGFSKLDYSIAVKIFDEYVNAAKMCDELVGFYNWCKDLGVARLSEFPEVQKISDEVLGRLERFLREKKCSSDKTVTSTITVIEAEVETETSMNEIKALPPPEKHTPLEDLVNLKDGADWELALVESANNFSKQNADMAGGFDSLLLNGMYDHGAVMQHVNNNNLSGGSSSSAVMPGLGRVAPMLALPSPDGTVELVGPRDPFAASLTVPPPAYVQIADMEKKRSLLVQEQDTWQQYGRDGMRGQEALAKINNGGVGHQIGYYY